MKFKQWLETREYQGEKPHEMTPLTPEDEWRVYHGIGNFKHAINFAKYGISGKDRNTRNYSFEQNNNPYGLFVTIKFDIAKNRFTFGNPKCIIEFNASIKDLEAPVWPGGRYTIQGEKSQSFRNRYERHQARLKAHIDAAYQEIPAHPIARKETEVIKKSYYPALARTLFGGERQALFMGHLNPDQIKFWVSENNEEFKPMDRAKLLEKYSHLEDEESSGKFRFRMFSPNDDFDPNKFIENLRKRFGKQAGDNLEFMWKSAINSNYEGMNMLQRYVWPKQLPGLIHYLHRKFGGSPRKLIKTQQ